MRNYNVYEMFDSFFAQADINHSGGLSFSEMETIMTIGGARACPRHVFRPHRAIPTTHGTAHRLRADVRWRAVRAQRRARPI